jgi:hypoxanthine phosphoribosyltransferase
VASYEGMSTTGNVKQVLGLKEDIEGRTVVVVEDIIDSGLTMSELLGILHKKHPAKIHIASLLVKPESMKVDLDIHYKCFDIPNDFILGYGLDYEGEGRNLRSIYRVVNS